MKLARTITLLFACLCISAIAHANDDYTLGPDSQVKPNVPQGDVTHYKWISKIFPGTVRDYWVYVPKQYNAASPACVMIIQDGGGFQSRDGQFRVPVVFDNLIAAKQMPVTVAIMIDPGVAPPAKPNALPRYNRSHEYDAVTDTYARFLIDEILPEVGKSLNLTKDPAGRALCGASSGGICSFIAAWERPDQFSKVISFVGSFTDLQGGNTYASQIRKCEPRPIRVLLQDGSADQDIYSGSWFLGNSDVAAALKFAGYDYKFVTGDGGHNGKQGGAILPDSLRWLWRDFPKQVAAAVNNRQPVMDVVVPGEGWKVMDGITGAAGVASDGEGMVYVSEPASNRIIRAGQPADSGFATIGATAIAVGQDGFLYAAEPAKHRIVAIDTKGVERDVCGGVTASGLVAAHNGMLYATDSAAGKVWLLYGRNRKIAVDKHLPFASGVTLTPDQSLLHVAQSAPGKYVFSYRLTQNGTTSDKQEYFDLRLPYGVEQSDASGMTVDTQGRLYVTSNSSVQILDQAGRVIGCLDNPDRTPTTAITFGGPGLDTLYIIAGGKLYTRKTKARGVLPFQDPIKPPGPRL